MTIPLESPSISDPRRAIDRNVDQLIEIVDRYDLHLNLDLLHALESLRKRTAAHRLTLAVFSDSRESKSSLIEALLGITLEETSIPPSTAACTYLAYGLQGDCAVTLADNMTAWLPLEQLAGFMSEKVSASNLKKVLVRIPNAALEHGLVVIDTPELTGDPEPILSATAAAVAEADACVLIVEPGGPSKENVIAFLRGMQAMLGKFFFVLKNPASLSGVEQEKSLELARRSLEQRCGAAQPRVALFSSVSPSSVSPELLGFALINSQRSTSTEVARVAREILAQVDGALNLRETAPLERMRLRRAVKALDGISRQSAELALASDAARPTPPESSVEMEPPEQAAAAESDPLAQTAAEESEQPLESAPPAAEGAPDIEPEAGVPQLAANVPQMMQMTGTTQTLAMMQTMPSLTGESFAAWIAAPSQTPLPAQALGAAGNQNDTTAPRQPEPERPASAPASAIPRRAVPRIFEPEPEAESGARFSAPPGARASREAEVPADRPFRAEPPAEPPFEWRSSQWGSGRDQRNQWHDAMAENRYDDDEFVPSDGIGPLWKMVGFAALLGAVLVIAWAVLIVVHPNYAQANHLRPKLAQLLAWRPAAARPAVPPAQPIASSSVTPIAPQPAMPQPPIPQSAAPQPVTPQPVTPPPPAAPSTTEATEPAPAQPLVVAPRGAPAYNTRHPLTDAALETALDKWVAASRSGNARAQADCYAPVVGTYFNSRNVPRQQVQRDKQRDSEAIAGVQNFHITTLGISDQGNGQRSALVEKDWDTPTGGGPAFAGNEIEKLVFAQLDGQWKIVGEQEVKLGKTHRTRGSRQMAANF